MQTPVLASNVTSTQCTNASKWESKTVSALFPDSYELLRLAPRNDGIKRLAGSAVYPHRRLRPWGAGFCVSACSSWSSSDSLRAKRKATRSNGSPFPSESVSSSLTWIFRSALVFNYRLTQRDYSNIGVFLMKSRNTLTSPMPGLSALTSETLSHSLRLYPTQTLLTRRHIL